jgi:hypothetical protein
MVKSALFTLLVVGVIGLSSCATMSVPDESRAPASVSDEESSPAAQDPDVLMLRGRKNH